jgi:hypothetical protein
MSSDLFELFSLCIATLIFHPTSSDPNIDDTTQRLVQETRDICQPPADPSTTHQFFGGKLQRYQYLLDY